MLSCSLDKHRDDWSNGAEVARFPSILLQAKSRRAARDRSHNGIFDPVSVFDRTSSDCVEEAGEYAHINNNVFPLSTAQSGIWLAQQIDPTSPAYNIGEYIEILGSVDAVLFERSLRQVVSEAQALHVKFIAGGPGQILDPSPSWSMPVFDVSAEVDARAAAEAWMKADLALPVDPTRGPLFGFALFKASERRFFWYARYHHLVMDGYGMWLVARRLADVYTQLCSGRSSRESSFGSFHSSIGRRSFLSFIE